MFVSLDKTKGMCNACLGLLVVVLGIAVFGIPFCKEQQRKMKR